MLLVSSTEFHDIPKEELTAAVSATMPDGSSLNKTAVSASSFRKSSGVNAGSMAFPRWKGVYVNMYSPVIMSTIQK